MGYHGGPKPQFYRCHARTHCIAYIGIPGMRGVQDICIGANRLDDVGRAYDLAQERNLPITLSFGQHTMDTLVSFYLRSPGGSTSSSAQAESGSARTSSRSIPRAPRSEATNPS